MVTRVNGVNHIILPMLSTTFGSPGSMVLDLMSRVYGLGSPGYPDYPGYPVTQVTQLPGYQVTRVSGLRPRLPRLPGSQVSGLQVTPVTPVTHGLRPHVSGLRSQFLVLMSPDSQTPYLGSPGSKGLRSPGYQGLWSPGSRVYGLGSPDYPGSPGYQGLGSQTSGLQVIQVTRVSGLMSPWSWVLCLGSWVSRLPSYPGYPGSKGLRSPDSQTPYLGSPDYPGYPWSPGYQGLRYRVLGLPSHHPQIHGTGLTSHLAIGAKTTLLQYTINGLPACLG
jgi:hypothetical protein